MSTRAGFESVVVIGVGEVARLRYRPALRRLAEEGAGIRQVHYVDVCSCCPIDLAPPSPFDRGEHYFATDGSTRGLIEGLERRGLTGRGVLALVCAPSHTHPRYAMALRAAGCRVGVEKPLARSRFMARALLPGAGSIYAVGHQLFKEEMVTFLGVAPTFMRGDRPLSVEFDLRETIEVRGQKDDVVWDLGWHGFECILAAVRSSGDRPRLVVEKTIVASYRSPDGARSRAEGPTAALIEGKAVCGEHEVPFVVRVGKGLCEEVKRLTIRSRGRRDLEVSLSETGWRAHYRLLRELIYEPSPDMRISLPEATEIVGLCCDARSQVLSARDYRFGRTPIFLRDGPEGDAERASCSDSASFSRLPRVEAIP